MRSVIAMFFVSLDGFASARGDDMSWFDGALGPQAEAYVRTQLFATDTQLLGRRTYETFAAFWPGSRHPNAARVNALDKVVFSRSLSGPLQWRGARLGSERDLAALKQGPGHEIQTSGSIGLVQSLMGQGLIDRVRLIVLPVVLGSRGGRRAFEDHDQRRLRLLASEVLDRDTLLLEYAAQGT